MIPMAFPPFEGGDGHEIGLAVSGAHDLDACGDLLVFTPRAR